MQNDRQFYVYVHRRKTDGTIFYVGKGKGQRYRQSQGRNKYWRRTAEKYGLVREISIANLTEDCAFCIEKILIASIPNLTNLSTGGEGSAGVPKSEEWKAKASERFKGKNHPMFGVHKVLTEDHKRKIGNSNRKPKPDGFGEKISKILSGRKLSSEQREKLKGSRNKGEDNPMHGKVREKSPRFDNTKFKFYHPDHGYVISTSYDMDKNYPVGYEAIRLLARGKTKKSFGWICYGPTDDEELPEFAIEATEKMRRYAA